MILTAKQEEGLRIAVQRHRDHAKYTVISGYAGTGKSTLVKFIIEALNVDPSHVCYAAYTGKAAQVLMKKGNKNVCTLHKLLFNSVPRPAGGYIRIPKKTIDYTVVIVDEVSMAPKTLMDLLFKHNVYVICLGDPFQLPPVEANEDNHLLDHPHIFLDEIMRQAAESEIIRLTMDIRAMKPLSDFKGQEVQIYNANQLVKGMYAWANQILTATNLSRHLINDEMRKMQGFSQEPTDGDKVICLRNYWDDCPELDAPLVNGTIGHIEHPTPAWQPIPRYAYDPGGFNVLQAHFVSESQDDFGVLKFDYEQLKEGKTVLEWRDTYKLGKLRSRIGDVVPKMFDYGYAITVHKAQGSEWDKVLVIEEKFPFKTDEHARWLYTAATRAAKKLVIIRRP